MVSVLHGWQKQHDVVWDDWASIGIDSLLRVLVYFHLCKMALSEANPAHKHANILYGKGEYVGVGKALFVCMLWVWHFLLGSKLNALTWLTITYLLSIKLINLKKSIPAFQSLISRLMFNPPWQFWGQISSVLQLFLCAAGPWLNGYRLQQPARPLHSLLMPATLPPTSTPAV